MRETMYKQTFFILQYFHIVLCTSFQEKIEECVNKYFFSHPAIGIFVVL